MLLGLLFYCCVIVSSTYTYDVPLAVWSGKDYIIRPNVGVSTYLTSNDAEIMIRSFIQNEKEDSEYSPLSQYLHTGNQPEIMVLFTEVQLRSDQLTTYSDSLSKFRNILSSAPTSLQAPFMDMPSAFDGNILNIVNSVQEVHGRVFYFGKGSPLLNDIISREQNTVVASRSDFEGTLKNSNIFSNGKTDLIIIYLSTMTASPAKFTETDTIISEVNKYISSITDDYLCVYTGLAYDNPEFNMEFGIKRTIMNKRYLSSTLQDNNGTTNGTKNSTVPIFRQYFGGWFWELFLTMLVLIPFLIIGTYSIDSIQTPLFEPKKKQ